MRVNGRAGAAGLGRCRFGARGSVVFGRLVLTERRRGVEVGGLLGDAERRELGAMLAEALRRYREPVFDNPQLRG